MVCDCILTITSLDVLLGSLSLPGLEGGGGGRRNGRRRGGGGGGRGGEKKFNLVKMERKIL